jgi:hypothetical protein
MLGNLSWLWVLFIPFGLFAYMLYLHVQFGDALAFMHVQKYWGNQIVGFWEILGPAINSVIHLDASWNVFVDTISALVFILLGLLAWRKFGAGVGVFCLALVLVPASATTISMVRYVSVIVPSFIVASIYLERWKWTTGVVALGAGLAGYFLVLYSHWIFVA